MIVTNNALLFVKTNLIDTDSQLVLNIPDQIVTLLHQEKILAQTHFSSYQFRLLALLLKLPGGALHAELLAILDCPEQTAHAVLNSTSEQRIITLLEPHIQRWQTHLSLASKQGSQERRRELATVRRAITGKKGINTLLKAFGLVVSPVYKQGYVLHTIVSDKANGEIGRFVER